MQRCLKKHKENRTLLWVIRKGKWNCTEHMLRANSLLISVFEGRRRTEVERVDKIESPGKY